jgi:hypothetical protein
MYAVEIRLSDDSVTAEAMIVAAEFSGIAWFQAEPVLAFRR